MQVGRVVGHATATVKHPTLNGWRLLLVQPLGVGEAADGEPVLAVDRLGAGSNDRVILTTDGAEVRKVVGSNNTPLRWLVIGLCDA